MGEILKSWNASSPRSKQIKTKTSFVFPLKAFIFLKRFSSKRPEIDVNTEKTLSLKYRNEVSAQ